MMNRCVPVYPIQGAYIQPGRTRTINCRIPNAPKEFVHAERAIMHIDISKINEYNPVE